jgi:CBS domain containing-hemolysin-like protein
MLIGFTICAVIAALTLTLVTVVQMLYMDSLRLRTKETALLQLFRSDLDERIGLKAEAGVLAFSLMKHSLLAILGAISLLLTAFRQSVSLATFAEAAGASWAGMILFAYIVPQYLYRRTSGRWLIGFVRLLRIMILAVRPLTAFLGFLQSLSELGEKQEPKQETPSHEENIEALITAGTEEGLIEEEDRKLIQSVVAFGDKTVREVMTPRPSMVTMSADASLEDLRQLVIHEQFSRIPVFEESIDNVIGFIHVRDMFELDYVERSQRTVRELVRPIRYVPETKAVNDLLREMQADGNHIAIVVDEYGNTAGLVTMEDMVEEIVGEIRDEHEPGHDVQRDSDGGFIVSGSFDVDHLQELLDYRLNEETESTTIGGLVTEWMGRVPGVGDVVERDGIRIEVLAANDLRVDQVRISKAEPATNV